MKISVIISTYNREKFLPRSIGSVLRQSYKNFEIIVVDDGSTDDTKKIMRNYSRDPRIKYFNLFKNQGVQAARNKGLDEANGNYVNILDSDDELLPDAFSETIKVVSRDRDIAIISAPYLVNGKERTSFYRDKSGYLEYTDLLCQRNVRSQKGGFAIINRRCVGNIRFVAPNLDFVFYRRLAKKGRMYFIAKPLGIYHLNEDKESLSVRRNVPNIELSIMRARALDVFLQEFKNDYLKHCPKYFSMYSYGAAVGLLLDNKKSQALKYARLMIRYYPQNIKYYVFLIFTLLPLSPKLLRLLFRAKKALFFKGEK